MKKFLQGLATAALFGLAMSPFAPGTAAQAGHFHTQTATVVPCVQNTLTGGEIKKEGGGAAVAENGKLEFSTGLSNDDYAQWRKNLAVPVKLSSLTELKYTVTKTDSGPNPAAAPALRLYLKNGVDTYTIVHEPYWQTGGNLTKDVPRTENAFTGKWWSGKAIGSYPGEPGSGPGITFSSMVEKSGTEMMIVGYGFQVGTYNQGTKGFVENFSFKASEACTVAPSPSVSPSVSPSGSSAPPVVAQPSLPVTGSKPLYLAGGAGVLLLAGVVLAIWGRRKRTRFEASA